MVPYDVSDHFEQIFLLCFDAGGRSLLIGDRLENCWLATGNSCIFNISIIIFLGGAYVTNKEICLVRVVFIIV